jgi:hypothetical protein
MPLATEPTVDGKDGLLNRVDSHWLYIMGRMKPGTQPAAVQQEVTNELKR